jgi:hypothetical protein
MKDRNLWSAFQHLSPDPEETFMALRAAVGGGTSRESKTTKFGMPPRIAVRYSQKDQPCVEVVGKFEADVEGLVAQCAALLKGERRWTTFPMAGKFRHSGTFTTDRLQIRPISDLGISGLTSIGASHDDLDPPLNAVLVDVTFNGASDPRIDHVRRSRAIREAANLISLATWPSLRQPAWSDPEEEWTLVWDPVSMALRNARLRRGFQHADIGDSVNAPTSHGGDALPTIEWTRFVSGPLDISDGHLHIAEQLSRLVTNYWSLPFEAQRRADRSATWYRGAQETPMLGAAIGCYATAIEALLPTQTSEKCECCGQPQYQISKHFSDFLTAHADKAVSKQFRDTIYDLRSVLTHGVELYEVDYPQFGIGARTLLDRLTVQSTVRAALLNWLHDPPANRGP